VVAAQTAGQDAWLRRNEVAHVLHAALRSDKARPYLPLFILLAVHTGRRKEAILSLRWCQIDLDAGLIDFEGSARVPNKRRGQIPIPKRLLPHLRRAGRGQPEMGFVLNVNDARIKDIKKGIAAAAKRSGVEGVTPHVFRHTAASWLMQSGMKIDKAARFLAMSEKTLEDVYGHLHPDFHKEAADTIGRRPGGSRMGR
jgi:integrase